MSIQISKKRTVLNMKFCAACSMPLDSDNVIGLEKDNESFCIHGVTNIKKLNLVKKFLKEEYNFL